jgi:heme A synthase
MAMQFARDLLPIFFDERWSMLTRPSSDAYHPLWAPLLVFETVMSLGFFVVSVVALVLFFRRSPRFPRIMIAYYAATLLFVAADLGLSSLLPGWRRRSGTTHRPAVSSANP